MATKTPKRKAVRSDENSSRYQVLDALRIFAALWVAIYHLSGGHGWFHYLKHPYGNILDQGKFGTFSSLIRLGFLGVPIFFVISGYVIVSSSRNKSPSEFLIARLSRLFPGFIFSVLVALLFRSYGFSGSEAISFEKFLSSFNLSWTTHGVSPIQGSYWTLWPEIRFYGLFLVFVLFFRRSNRFERRATIFFLAWLGTLWFSLSAGSLLGMISVNDYAIYFILGGLLSIAAHGKNWVGVSIFLLAGVPFAIINLRHWIFSGDSKHPMDWRLGCVIFYVAILLIGIGQKVEFRSVRVRRAISTLGKASYTFYLLQEGLGMPMTSFLVVQGMQIRYAIALSMMNVLAISVGFTVWIEARSVRFIRERFGVGLKGWLDR